jgi:hypothetical protein
MPAVVNNSRDRVKGVPIAPLKAVTSRSVCIHAFGIYFNSTLTKPGEGDNFLNPGPGDQIGPAPKRASI